MKSSKILLHAFALVLALGFSALLLGCADDKGTVTPSGTSSAKM